MCIRDRVKRAQDRLPVDSDSSYDPCSERDSSSDSASRVYEFLEQKVPKWAPNETLSDLGLDSLDMAQMRASFNRDFSRAVGMDIFANPVQTLAQLANKLQEVVC
eukprot:TRINITY_DN27227_c0_g1_i3.p1 TRINITY_DN27227_c0_g1~~TRINITY_DN27227_c0_g1_i3.p1  ORF type:complete len:105 (+),score=31.97 TRINITY_DN27227_c0_g1_i3:146-460(+)